MKMTKITRKELILFTALLLFCAIALLFMARRRSGTDMGAVRITIDGKTVGEYPLNRDRTIRIGTTNVCRIQGGTCIMTRADCPDHLCMRIFAPIDQNGGMIVCLPNRVVIEGIPAQGAEDTADGIDAVSG